MKASATTFLGLVHGNVGSLDHALGIVARIGVNGDTDRRRSVHLAVADLVFFGEHEQQFLRRGRGIAHFAEVFETHDELVTTPTSGEIADAEILAQADSNITKQGIADIVTEGVVDGLEAIEVDEKYGELRRLAFGTPDGAFEVLRELAAIRQPRQFVVLCAFLELDRLFRRIGDVAERDHTANEFAIAVVKALTVDAENRVRLLGRTIDCNLAHELLTVASLDQRQVR